MTNNHGGARPKRRQSDRRGGARPGAGGLVKSASFSAADARTLRTILLARYGKADRATVDSFFAGVIREQWSAMGSEEMNHATD